MRWVKLSLPPRVRWRWLLAILRLTSSSLAGTGRTLVAVGTASDAAMFFTMLAPAPRIGSPLGGAVGAGVVAAGAGAAVAGAGAAGAVVAAGAGAGAAGGAAAGAGAAALALPLPLAPLLSAGAASSRL